MDETYAAPPATTIRPPLFSLGRRRPDRYAAERMDQYLTIVLLLVVSVAFGAGSFAASKLLGPARRRTSVKEGPYESGIVTEGPSAVRFPVRFYVVAMIFIIFDIEVIFLYPWAVIYNQLNTFGLAEMAAFALVVFVSFAYLVSNGALDWGPAVRLARRASGDLTRTTTSTVRRVPRPFELDDGMGTRAEADDEAGPSGTDGGPEPPPAPRPEPPSEPRPEPQRAGAAGAGADAPPSGG
jgi:NADH-quinone oxidoreductase subunit A